MVSDKLLAAEQHVDLAVAQLHQTGAQNKRDQMSALGGKRTRSSADRWSEPVLSPADFPTMPTRPLSDQTSTLISGGLPNAPSIASKTFAARTSSVRSNRLPRKKRSRN